MRAEDGCPTDVPSAARDLPFFFGVIEKGELAGKEIARRYDGLKVDTLGRYVKTALTESEKLLKAKPEDLDPGLAQILEEALDNFRPGWRQSGKK
jgi:hypothetical protein